MAEDDPVSRRENDVHWKEAENAVRLARDDISRRLDSHDRDLTKVASDTSTALLQTREREAFFHTRVAHEEFANTITERFERLRTEMKPKWIIWVAAAGVFTTATVAISTGIWTLGINPIKEKQSQLDAGLIAHLGSDQETRAAAEKSDQNIRDDMNKLREQVMKNTGVLEELRAWIHEHGSMKK